jgi:hypothetical protein
MSSNGARTLGLKAPMASPMPAGSAVPPIADARQGRQHGAEGKERAHPHAGQDAPGGDARNNRGGEPECQQ